MPKHEQPGGIDDLPDYSREAVLARKMLALGVAPPDSPRMQLESKIDGWARQFYNPESFVDDGEISPVVRLAPGDSPVLVGIGIAGSTKLEVDYIEPSTATSAAAICCHLAGDDDMAMNPEFAKHRLEEAGVTTRPGWFLIVTGGKDMPPALVPLDLVNVGRNSDGHRSVHQYVNDSRRDPVNNPAHMLTDEECLAVAKYLGEHEGYVDYGEGAESDE